MLCEICRLNRGTHCGYSGGPVPGECGHGVADVDKLVVTLTDRDARIADMREILQDVLTDGMRSEIEKRISGKESGK